MPLTFNYVSFVVADLERSLDFYRTLGLPIPAGAHLNSEGGPEQHVEIDQNGLRIAWETEDLVQRVYPGWVAPPKGQARIGAALEAGTPAEVDAACERLQAQGYEVETAPYDAFWGQRYATVTDPDGNSVDVFAWLEGQG
ncbi:VOC family protein [Deinococcus sp. QL22]|uniref:VOC family protein n=1 Tax=Deinococcus sp. QL22 TaxID=2939437 RepID=UPI0020178339|nr:VOC family protein [Deinococcus sp. QL22]UQN05096.1 VOC family protein [Deinococcus sp. QL22]